MAQNGYIKLGGQELRQLRAQSLQQWGREPSARELDDLVQGWVREEVLVREALAQGLDKDDVVVRRRLVQKMEFLVQSASVAPTASELQAFYQAHADRYAAPPAMDIEQLYFNAATRGVAVQRDALAVRASLQQGQAPTGDRFMLPRHLPQMDVAALARDFGDGFARAVRQLPPGQWSVPLASAHGWHLVRVLRQTPGQALPLAQVRERVERDWAQAQALQVRDAAYATLRSKYTVELPARPEADAAVQLSAAGAVLTAAKGLP